MTLWRPDLRSFPGPKYEALAQAIAADIDSGRLKSGTRLPTHRELAQRLGVTIGTVSRGYAEAHRRGLVVGEVGRGTFVRAARPDPVRFHRTHEPETGVVDLSFNLPSLDVAAEFLREELARIARHVDLTDLLQYQVNAGSRRHREAAARWLTAHGLPSSAEDVVITGGAQHAMLLVFSVLAEPGDVVLAECLTFPGMKAVARLLRLHLEGVAMDDEGLRPDALAEACRQFRPKALYCTPTFQNPTGRVMGEARRREIMDIARAHRLPVVEDDIYGFLSTAAHAPLAAQDETSTYYITSFSKCVAPGLRLGFLRAPRTAINALGAAIMTTAQMASPLSAEIIASMAERGSLDDLIRRHRKEIAARQTMARAILGPFVGAETNPESSHLWLSIPDPWRVEEFVAEARTRGVSLASPEVFAVGRSSVAHGIRVSLGAVRERGELEAALRTVAELLAAQPMPIVAGL